MNTTNSHRLEEALTAIGGSSAATADILKFFPPRIREFLNLFSITECIEILHALLFVYTAQNRHTATGGGDGIPEKYCPQGTLALKQSRLVQEHLGQGVRVIRASPEGARISSMLMRAEINTLDVEDLTRRTHPLVPLLLAGSSHRRYVEKSFPAAMPSDESSFLKFVSYRNPIVFEHIARFAGDLVRQGIAVVAPSDPSGSGESAGSQYVFPNEMVYVLHEIVRRFDASVLQEYLPFVEFVRRRYIVYEFLHRNIYRDEIRRSKELQTDLITILDRLAGSVEIISIPSHAGDAEGIQFIVKDEVAYHRALTEYAGSLRREVACMFAQTESVPNHKEERRVAEQPQPAPDHAAGPTAAREKVEETDSLGPRAVTIEPLPAREPEREIQIETRKMLPETIIAREEVCPDERDGCNAPEEIFEELPYTDIETLPGTARCVPPLKWSSRDIRGASFEVQTKEPLTDSLDIFLGHSQNSERVFWSPGNLNNGHFIIIGGSGAGKTETIRCIAAELEKKQFPVLMIDFHGDMATASGTGRSYKIREGSDYYFNPLELDPAFEGITPLRATSDFVDAISINFPTFGIQQRRSVKGIIKDAYRRAGITHEKETWFRRMNFDDIEDQIMNCEDEAIPAYLEDIFDYKLFSGTEKISIASILGGGITHINLNALPENLRYLFADLFLRRLFYSLQALGEIPRDTQNTHNKFRLFIIVDEAKLLVSQKTGQKQVIKAVLNKYATEMRKFGVSLILASQLISHFNDEILANIAVKLCMRTENKKQAQENSRFFEVSETDLMNFQPGEGILSIGSEKLNIKILPARDRKSTSIDPHG